MSANEPKRLPLNGTKTHPLSEHAIGVLRRLNQGPLEAYTINPGVRDRLYREDLAEPGIDAEWRVWRITTAGRAAITALQADLDKERGDG